MNEKSLDVTIINPFINATLACLSQMAKIESKRERIFVKTNAKMHGSVTGIIGLTNGITGSVAVSFPHNLAKLIVARLLGDSPDKLSEAVIGDGIGEVANMVAGGAKRAFAETEHRFNISTPTVIMGDQTSMFNPAPAVTIAAEFSTSISQTETFLIEIAFRPNKD
jgi:chemotaxis protein CheX